MAIPLIVGGLAALAGSAMSAHSQNRVNQRATAFQREMFDKTNAYNHPSAQMARLKEAGLNPNLVYGSSSGGSAGTASQPSQPDLKAVDYSQAGASVQNAADNYFNYRAIETGIEVNEARTEQIKQDTINAGIDAVNKTIKAGAGAVDLDLKRRVFDTNVKMAEERLRNLSVQTGYTQGKDSREERITTETVAKLKQETSNARTQGRILSEDAIMKAIDRKLYDDYKVRPQDPIYYRIIGQILQQLGYNPFKK